jgi:hypothetical protein
VYIELGDHDFSGKVLRGISLRAAKLKKADFSSAILQQADFRGANLNDAKLIHADCTGVDMRQSRIANRFSPRVRGEWLDAEQYEEITRQVKAEKHRWAQEILAEQPPDAHG